MSGTVFNASPERPTRTTGLALAVILAVQMMMVVDASVVNIALPKIETGLHFSATGLSWVLNAYLLTFGGLLLLGGRTGDILGRRRVLTGGVVVFTIASLLGGLSTSPGLLLAARAVQGIGAAFASPSCLALIATNFPEGRERARALALFSAVSIAGGSIGLILGGVLTEWVSWRWVLFINVPFGVAVTILAPRLIAEPQRHEASLDIAGAISATGAMASLVYGLIRASASGWGSPFTIGALALAAVLLGSFVAIERRSRDALMPLRLFAERNRSGALAAMMLMVATMYGMFFFLTQFLQEVLGFKPLTAGLAFLPLTVPVFACSRFMPRLLARTGPRPLLVLGGVLVTTAVIWLAQLSPGSTYLSIVFGPMVLLGFGVGVSFLPLNVTVLAGVERRDTGAISGALQTMQQSGAALGLAVLVTIFGAARRQSLHTGATKLAVASLVHGISTAFLDSIVFAVLSLVIVTTVIRPKVVMAPV